MREELAKRHEREEFARALVQQLRADAQAYYENRLGQ